MWLSCSAFFSQYCTCGVRARYQPLMAVRVYGLVSWPSKTDKSGALVRKYCPELKDFPDKVCGVGRSIGSNPAWETDH